MKMAWVIALISAPLLGYLIGSSVMLDWTESSWRWRNVAWIAIGAGLPVALAIAHTKSLGVIGLSLAVGGTTLPAAFHLKEGARTDDAEVRAVKCEVRERHGSGCIEYEIELVDGRSFHADKHVARDVIPKEIVRVTHLGDVAMRIDGR